MCSGIMKESEEKYRNTVMGILLGICCALTFYLRLFLGVEVVYSHFSYIPIIFASLWWKRKGLVVAIFLASLLVFIHPSPYGFYIDGGIDDLVRASFFIIVAYVIALVSEKEAKRKEDIAKEKRFSENIVATVPDSLLILDRDLRIKKANLSFQNVFGTNHEKVIGTHITDVLGDEDGKLSTELTKLFGTEEMLNNFELPYQSVNLDERIFNITARGIIVEEEEEELLVIEDITRQKRAEEALQASRESFRNIVDKSADGIAIVDSKGIVRFINPMTETLFGRKVEELMGRMFGFPVAAGSLTEVDIIRKGGKIGIAEMSMVETEWEGENAYLVSLRDVTERRRAEEESEKMQAQLLQAQKLEAVGTLTAGIAHDFNNLLLVIQSYANLSMMKVGEADPLHENLKEIHLTCMSAADLIRKLLLFSRKQQMNLTLFNINSTVDDLLKILNRLIGEDIAVNADLEPELWMVLADEGNIEQVIMNLAVNARDAMPKGGKLSIKTENVTLDEDNCKVIPEARPGKFVSLSVADTGIGIDKGNIQHIFEPFFSTKDVGAGTGLGLSVVYGIVKQHGGWINVYSEPGQGSTFKVFLPASSVKPEEETKETISVQELQGSGERILLVEDEEKIRKVVTMMLRENGYVVLEAASAEEAQEIFEREKGKFHLVFSDVVMPGKSGIQLVDQLHSRKPELPVLLSSGYVDTKSHRPTIHERGFPFLQKPYALDDLLRAIKETIEPS